MTDESLNLLPCPFCGGNATATNYVVEAAVRCGSCGATILCRHPPTNDDGLPEAIAAWNRRALSHPADTDTIHSCSPYCDRPACVKAQRDEMRDAAPVAVDAVTDAMVDRAREAYDEVANRDRYPSEAGMRAALAAAIGGK